MQPEEQLYIRGMAKGNVALVLAALAFAFTVYLGVWNTNRHSGNPCDKGTAYVQNCDAQKEDSNLMLVSGAVTVGLLGFGLVRRYQPSSGRGEDHPPRPSA